MTIVGALARIEPSAEALLPARLENVEGVSSFPLEAPGRIGLLIEAETLDAAHAKLSEEVSLVEGILGVWPVYAHAGTDLY